MKELRSSSAVKMHPSCRQKHQYWSLPVSFLTESLVRQTSKQSFQGFQVISCAMVKKIRFGNYLNRRVYLNFNNVDVKYGSKKYFIKRA